jgi:hypothetical protein
LPKLSDPSTIGALVSNVMQSDSSLKNYATEFSLATMQKWFKGLSKGALITVVAK